MDAVDYSTRITTDGDNTVRTVRRYHTEVIAPGIERHGGSLIGRAGDSWLMEFASADRALRFAQEVQAALGPGAAAVRADRCDIYTDVDGIYTTDPRIVPRARKLERVSYEEMLELASVGAKVLQTRSVELAMKQRVRVQVLSSFEDKPGSLVVDEDEIVEQPLVSGIAYSRDDAKVTLRRVPDRPGVAARVFDALAGANVNVDMIVQNVGADGSTDITFTVGKADLARAQDVLGRAKAELGFEGLLADPEVAKISVVGIGMRSHAGVANTMFRALAEKNINIQVISTSEIKVSVLVGAEYTELAVRSLHTAYGLDGPAG